MKPAVFAIRRCGYSRDFEIVMFNGGAGYRPVQVNIKTMEKAEAALNDWVRRANEMSSGENSDVESPPPEQPVPGE